MTNKILIIIASARKQSDTKKQLEKVFAEIEYKLLDLLDFNVCPYDYLSNYHSSDNFIDIIEEISCYDKIIFATPVYWYSMSGLLKTFLDRLTDLVTIHKTMGRNLKGKKTFLFAVGSDDLLPSGFVIPFELTPKYFGMTFKDSIYFSINKITNDKTSRDKEIKFVGNIKNH